MQEFRIQRFRGGFAVVWEEDGKRRRLGLKAQSRKEAEAALNRAGFTGGSNC
jgi:hypothetical protein